ncbi:MAG: DUF3347 domain-containing protein [Deltaproteobacteria bacterium]|nr:DUF3347 domain-containing protein [Deltaproteobacteria bacterium]
MSLSIGPSPRACLVAGALCTVLFSSCAKQSAAAGNGPEHPTPTSEKPDPAPGSSTPAAIVADTPKAKALVEGLTAYAAVRKALAGDDLPGAKAAAPAAAAKVAGMKATHAEKAPEIDSMAAAAHKVAASADIATARMAFGEFSRTLIGFVAADKGVAGGVVCYRCPMAKTYQKWLQLGDEMGNPYWGAEMLKCGSKVPVAP